jgi:hypothetical protein
MTTYKALKDQAGSGLTYSIPFNYLAPDTVKAEVAGTEDSAATVSGYTRDTDGSLTGGTLTLSSDPGASTVRIRRETPTSYIGNIPDAAALVGRSIRQALLTSVYINEEIYDADQLAREMFTMGQDIVAPQEQVIIGGGGPSYQLGYNVKSPAALWVTIDGVDQNYDTSFLAGLGSTPSEAYGLWYDSVRKATYIRFSEDIPSGQKVYVKFLYSIPVGTDPALLDISLEASDQVIVGTGTNTYALSTSVRIPAETWVTIDGVDQIPDPSFLSGAGAAVSNNYGIYESGGTQYIKFSEDIPSGQKAYVKYVTTA